MEKPESAQETKREIGIIDKELFLNYKSLYLNLQRALIKMYNNSNNKEKEEISKLIKQAGDDYLKIKRLYNEFDMDKRSLNK